MGTKIVLQHNPSEADIRPPLAFMSTRLSRKIYISEARLQALRVRRQRLDQLCTPLRYLVATVATLTAISASRWPGGQSHLSSRKIYELCSMKGTAHGQCCRLSAKHSISFAFHFVILCSGHRGHSGHRFFLGLKWTITSAILQQGLSPKSFGMAVPHFQLFLPTRSNG